LSLAARPSESDSPAQSETISDPLLTVKPTHVTATYRFSGLMKCSVTLPKPF